MTDVLRIDGKDILRSKGGKALDSELFDQDGTDKYIDAVQNGGLADALIAQVLANLDRQSED